MKLNTLTFLVRCAKEYGHTKIKKTPVGGTEHYLLSFFYFHKKASQDEAAKALRLDKTTVSKALLSMEKKGMLTRIPDTVDRRKKVTTLTEKGKESIAPVIEIYHEWISELETCLTPEERDLFQSYCDRLLAKAEQMNEALKNC